MIVFRNLGVVWKWNMFLNEICILGLAHLRYISESDFEYLKNYFRFFGQNSGIMAVVELKRTGLFLFSLWIDCCYKTSFENQQYTAIDRKKANILFILLVLKRPSIQTICPNSKEWIHTIYIKILSKRVKFKL